MSEDNNHFPTPVTEQTIGSWLTEWCCLQLDLDRCEIDSTRPLATYGFDSANAMSLLASIEDGLGVRLSQDFIHEEESLETLSDNILALAESLRAEGSDDAAGARKAIA